MKLLKIGRDPGCDIVLHSANVSAIHAELTLLDSGDMMLEDKNSRNGTFVMNQAIKSGKPVKVQRGDLIRFADVDLQWSQVPMPEDNSAYKGIYGIGSHFNNYIQLSGATVSRYHATIKHGKDGKFYIVDHSMNGTTVDGVKISSNTPYRIRAKSSIVCGGVPVSAAELTRIPGLKSFEWKSVAAIAACIIVLAGIGYAAWTIIPGMRQKTWTAQEINSRYSTSLVYLGGVYHYKVTIDNMSEAEVAKVLKNAGFSFSSDIVIVETYGNDVTLKDWKTMPEEEKFKRCYYSGTGFFVSDEGDIITNLHVVKPWLMYPDRIKKAEEKIKKQIEEIVEVYNTYGYLTGGFRAYASQIKIEGVSDALYLLPNGKHVSSENVINCHVRSTGDNDLEKDVALIQSDKMDLPNKKTTYINIKDSMDVSDEAITVGKVMFTVGYPHGGNNTKEKGLQSFCHEGKITSVGDDYSFFFDANSAGGASGSPIFNEYGMLIGILNAGIAYENINLGIKAKYIKELIDNPHKE